MLPVFLAILGAWFAVRWYVGNTIAEYAPAPEDGGIDMARMATRWAPGDPLAHWRLASFDEKNFSAENMAAAVREYEHAVMSSPYDYRYWMELGRALEANGDRENAEKALRRAVDLAPAYSHPRWLYGNILLRQGRVDEAFEQLSRAAEADQLMRPSVFGLAWQVYNGDLDKMVKAVPSPVVRMQFAVYLIQGGRYDDASHVLHAVSPADRKAQSGMADEIVKSLIEKKQFRAALNALREIETDAAQLPSPEQFWNGGFEKNISPSDQRLFHWLINSRPQAQISVDTHAHDGNGSLRIVFKSPNKLERVPLSQTIIVEPGTQYRIQFYQRTENIVSASTPVVAVSDAADGTTLTNSPPLPSGTHDWQQITLDFKTKPKSDGIVIGFYRGSCGEGQPICPIFGTVWYDDFNLQRIGGPGSSRRDSGSTKR